MTPIHGWSELMSFSSLNVPNQIPVQLLHPAGPARLYLDRCADRSLCSCGRETGRYSGALLIDRAHLNPPSNSGTTLGLSLSPSSRVGATLKVTGNQQDLFICIFMGSCKKKKKRPIQDGESTDKERGLSGPAWN